MPTVYPGAFDNFVNPDSGAGDTLDSVPHDQQHDDANDAIEAIEHVLGVEPNGAYATVRAYIDAVGTALLGAITDIANKVNRSGDTMTGPLLLNDYEPTDLAEATPKAYVDAQVSNVVATLRPQFPLLGEAVGWWDARVALSPDGNVVDLTGRGNDMALTPGTITGVAPPRLTVATGRERCLFLPGFDDMYVDTPDPGPITGIDFAWEGDPAFYVNSDGPVNWLIHQGSVSDNDFSFAIGVDLSQRVVVDRSADGTTVVRSTSVASIDSGEVRFAVTVDATTGDMVVYTQDFTDPIADFDEPYASWTELDTVAGAGALALFNSTATVRMSQSGNLDTTDDPDFGIIQLPGSCTSMYRSRLRDDVEGTDLVYLDTCLIPSEQEWYLESGLPVVGSVTDAVSTDFLGWEGETWTIHNYDTTSFPCLIVERPFILFGSGTTGVVASDDQAFDIRPGEDFSVWIAYTFPRTTGGLTSGGPYIALKDQDPTSAGWMVYSTPTPTDGTPMGFLGDGSGYLYCEPVPGGDGRLMVSGFQLDQTLAGSGDPEDDDTNTLTSVTNGRPASPTATSGFGDPSNPGAFLTFANFADTIGDNHCSYAFAGAAIFRRKLSAFEAQVLLPYEFGLTPPIPESVADTPEALYVLTTDIPTTGTAGAEETLQAVVIPPGQLSRDGDKLQCRWTASAIAHATATRRARLYFGGTQIMDTTAYASTNGGTYSVDLEIIRVSDSVVRVSATGGFPPYSALSPLPYAAGGYAEVTGLDLSDWQELRATGAVAGVGAAAGDMVGRSMTVTYHPGP